MAPPPVPITLSGMRVVLRPIRREDRTRLRAMFVERSVARWWGTGGPDKAVDDLYGDDAVVLVIEVGGEIAGSIQFHEEDEPDYRHAAIDIFLDTAHQGQGFGAEAIRLLARYLFEERGHHRLTIDPAASNERAIASYEKVGFRRVGVMRNYERGPDGTWHDGLLMDMLPGELAAD